MAEHCGSIGNVLGPAGEESANKQACLVRGGNENMAESNFQKNITKTPLFYILCIAMSWDNAKNQVDLPRTETLSTASDDYEILSPQLGPALCCAPCFELFDHDDTVVEGNAFDIIMIQSEDNKVYQNSEFLVSFGGRRARNLSEQQIILELRGGYEGDEVTDLGSPKAWFPIIRTGKSNKDVVEDSSSHDDDESYPWNFCCHPLATPGKITDLNGTAGELEITEKLAPYLSHGKNPIRFLLLDQHKVKGVAHASIFLWSYQDRVVVSDIDGTITKSNAQGVVDTILTETYKHCHDGICQLLSSLKQKPNTQILYVTSRPIGLATHTRKFLANLEQGSARLPEGPLLGFGGNIPQLLVMELISMKTHHFKAEILWNQVVKPFRNVANSSSASPIFIAGFGNTMMDVQAYHMAGIDLDKIYLINKKSELAALDRKPHQEWTNLTSARNGTLFAATLGVPRPRHWYKGQLGTKFSGYTDDSLLPHVWKHSIQHMSESLPEPKTLARAETSETIDEPAAPKKYGYSRSETTSF